jgi:ribosome-binding protein aMBF1 (putative translation factor)
MDKGPSELRLAYKLAVKQWIVAIHEEENLALPDHSATDMEEWENANLIEDQARERAKKARDAYKDTLRAIKSRVATAQSD